MSARNEVEPASPCRLVSRRPAARGREAHLEVGPGHGRDGLLKRERVELLVVGIRHVLGIAHPEGRNVVDARPIRLDDGDGLDSLVLDFGLVAVLCRRGRRDGLLNGRLGPEEDRGRAVLGVLRDERPEPVALEVLKRIGLEPERDLGSSAKRVAAGVLGDSVLDEPRRTNGRAARTRIPPRRPATRRCAA